MRWHLTDAQSSAWQLLNDLSSPRRIYQWGLWNPAPFGLNGYVDICAWVDLQEQDDMEADFGRFDLDITFDMDIEERYVKVFMLTLESLMVYHRWDYRLESLSSHKYEIKYRRRHRVRSRPPKE